MPTDLPRARAQARQLRQSLLQIVGQQASAPTQIATVADVSAQFTTGVVIATTNKGPIQVAGVPLNTVCPGAQIYVRQLGIKSLYVYDGLAGSYTNRLTTSGSIQSLTGAGPVATTNLVEQNGTIIPANGISLASNPNFYLSFMFSLSALPDAHTTTTLVDLSMLNSGQTAIVSTLQVVYLPSGNLQINVTNWNGYSYLDTTSEYFAPRRTWWVYVMGGVGMTVNAIRPASSTGFSFFSGTHSTTPVAGLYGLWALGDHTYGTPAPIGSWISKLSFGFAPTATLPTTMLTSDSQVPQDTACWLCTSGDTATNPSYPQLPQVANVGAYVTTGPY